MHRTNFTSEILQERDKERSQSAKNKSQSLHLLYRTRPKDCLVSSGEEDDATVLPSNQLANQADQRSTSATNVVETPHGSRNLPQQGQEDEEEEDNWNFLTQFIGSPASSNRATQTDNNVDTANLEAANFRFITICFYLIHNLITIRSQYLEDTEVLDRAKAHLTALNKAEMRHPNCQYPSNRWYLKRRTHNSKRTGQKPLPNQKESNADSKEPPVKGIGQCCQNLIFTAFVLSQKVVEKTNVTTR